MRYCRNCQYFTYGVSDSQRRAWNHSNWGRTADGVCNLDFPRGYIARKAPHPAHANGSCFQYDPKEDSNEKT